VTCSVRERLGWVDPEHALLSVREQCTILELNRSSVYYTPRPIVFSDEQQGLLRLVDEIYTKYPFFGTRQMSDYISLHHYCCKRHEIRWAYGQLSLQSLAPGPHTSKPRAEHRVYPYLLQGVEIVRPCQVFSTDITYIRLRRGFVYLTAIMDWYSRFVLDWQLSINMEADFCIETLQRVLAQTRCDIFNTDQGAQFTSTGFTDVLKTHKIDISMDGKGRWVDNVFVERLWRSVKYECVYLQEWENVSAVKEALDAYFKFYNYDRPHQSLSGLTPSHIHGQKMLH
jgi:putative transposase